MAKTSFFRNKGKNLVLVCAVFLAVFMLFSIFTVGLTYVKMEKRQNIRLSGEDMDAIMYGMTKEQVKKCENSSEVSKIGKVGVAGYAISTQWDDTLHTGLIYSDKTYWDEIMAPARKETKGHYPKQEDEVMVTQTALEDCGLSGLGIGDTFTLTYGDNNGTEPKEKTFKICGIWDGYGTKKVFFVSKKFYQQSGYQLSDVRSGRMYLQFKSKILTTKKREEFRKQMDLGVQQALFLQPKHPIPYGLNGNGGTGIHHLLECIPFDLQYSLFIGFRKYPLLRLTPDSRDDRNAGKKSDETSDALDRNIWNWRWTFCGSADFIFYYPGGGAFPWHP